MRVDDLEAIKIKLVSPEDILSWSHGEVTKPETINYRTQKPEKDGLFCERIFGPVKDYQCACGKYKRIRYKGVVCDRCGVEVTSSKVRRERMGHIKLACPVSHIWFLRGVPSRMGLVLNVPGQKLERVVYFASYIVTKVDQEAKKRVLEEIEQEYREKLKTKDQKPKIKNQKPKTKNQKSKTETKSQKEESAKQATKLEKKEKLTKSELKKARDRAREEVMNLKPLKILSEVDYQQLSLKYGHIFEAGTGAEALWKIFQEIDLKEEIKKIKKKIVQDKGAGKKKDLIRLKTLEDMEREKIRPEWMFLTVIPVMPPDLRPMVQLDGGRFASSDLNDLYRRVINRNNRLKYLLEISAPEVIVRNEKRMLQEAVDALIDNGMRKGTMTRATTGGARLLKSVADMLKGKQGRFRQNLLGKRVDYSGRSVIVIGPELRLHQTGLPKKMALELFKPFVMKKILEKELAYNLRAASRLVDEQGDEVWAILEEVTKDKYVLLNRAPTLHRLGIQAFEPILIEGEAIRIHPLVCRAFNADFDGDQMAVHIPLSREAQAEAQERMLSSVNLLKPATGKPIVVPSQDIVMGCFWLTKVKKGARGEGRTFGSFGEAVLAYEMEEIDLRALIRVRVRNDNDNDNDNDNGKLQVSDEAFVETTVGRIFFNEVLPEDYPFQNQVQDIKALEAIVSTLVQKYPAKVVGEVLDKIKALGFENSTRAGISWGMDDLVTPPEKKEIISKAEREVEKIEGQFRQGLLSREERRARIIEVWQRAKMEVEQVVPKALPEDGPVITMVESGSRGSWLQVVQMTGMKGLVINPLGQIIELPVKSSYKEGFDVLEYFNSTHGARKGTTDTALRTSTAGYLTRRLIDVAHEVIVNEEDCGDKKGIVVFRESADKISQDFTQKIFGRQVLEDVKAKIGKGEKEKVIVKKGEFIDWEKAKEIVKAKVKKVRVRSPLTCQAKRGVCQKCYGWDLGRNELVALGEAVGIVAAQAIGEPGTQLTMRTFHTGGVARGGDITLGLPRVEEIFEARTPGGRAQLSKVDGKVLEVTPDRVIKIKPLSSLKQKSPSKGSGKKKEKDEVLEYQIPSNQAILVQKGQEVKKGQPLGEGSLDIKELFRLAGIEEVWRYIVQEIQKVYVSQGAIIHDKHIEVIVRQMFSRVRIKEEGDSPFIRGETVELAKFSEVNQALRKEGKKEAKGKRIVLGISRVALTTDSFLSAASFQETSRVLIKAALAGKEDKLRGLKENVIIGKLIPAGTGFRK